MKSFVISHLKLVIIITCIVVTTIIGGIITFSVIKSNNNNISIQSNERNKDKIQIEVIADSVKIRESKDPNSQVIGNVYKNEIYSVISEDKESQYKWLEIETSNGIKGYIVGIEAYVKRLETTIIIEKEQKPNDNPNIDNENINNNVEKPNNSQTENNQSTNQKPNNNSNTNKPNNNNNTSNKPNIDNNKQNNENINNNEGNTTPKQEVIEAIPNVKDYDIYSLDSTKGFYLDEYIEREKHYYCLGDNVLIKKDPQVQEKIYWCKYDVEPIDYEKNKIRYIFHDRIFFKCPDNYKHDPVDGMCVPKDDYPAWFDYKSCPTGYYELYDNMVGSTQRVEKDKCYKIYNTKKIIGYSCPNGYTLKNNKCYK